MKAYIVYIHCGSYEHYFESEKKYFTNESSAIAYRDKLESVYHQEIRHDDEFGIGFEEIELITD